MAVKHILKDGQAVNDIQGHVVKMENAEAVYSLMDKINQRKELNDDKRNRDSRMVKTQCKAATEKERFKENTQRQGHSA